MCANVPRSWLGARIEMHNKALLVHDIGEIRTVETTPPLAEIDMEKGNGNQIKSMRPFCLAVKFSKNLFSIHSFQWHKLPLLGYYLACKVSAPSASRPMNTSKEFKGNNSSMEIAGIADGNE